MSMSNANSNSQQDERFLFTTPTAHEICESFQNSLQQQDNIDIYQACAVAWRIANDRWVARLYYFKACVCFVFQTTMLCLMVYQFSRENVRLTLSGEHPNQQDMSNVGKRYHMITKAIAFVASVWISVNVWSWLRNLEQQSLYKMKIQDFENCPVYVNHTFVAVGKLVNFFTLFMALMGNNIVIYFAENSLEVLLNCVAIFWLFEIDNQLIGPNDYQRMRNWIKQYVAETKNEQKRSEKMKELKHRCGFNCGCFLCCCCCCSSFPDCSGCGAEEERRDSVELHAQNSTLQHGGDEEDQRTPATTTTTTSTHSVQPSDTVSEMDDASNAASVQTNSYPANEDTKQTDGDDGQDEEEEDNDDSHLVEVSIAEPESQQAASSHSNCNDGQNEMRTCGHSSCSRLADTKATCSTRSFYVVITLLEVFTFLGSIIAPIVIFVLSFLA